MSLLFRKSLPVADGIELQIRTVGEIMEFGEERYFAVLSIFLADPYDYMAALDDVGIDFEQVSKFELFVMLATQGVDREMLDFLFAGTLPLDEYVPAMNNDRDELVMVRADGSGKEFSALTLSLVASAIRKVHYFTEERHQVGNKEAKRYLLELAHRKERRNRRRRGSEDKPVLEPLVISLVNAPEFPYDYQSVQQITIYQFFSSVHKIPKRLEWNFVMHGVHVGMISAKELNWEELNWMG